MTQNKYVDCRNIYVLCNGHTFVFRKERCWIGTQLLVNPDSLLFF